MAAQIVAQNFAALSVGNAAGFTPASGSSAFGVTTTGEVSSPNALGQSAANANQYATYTGTASPANQCFQFDQIVNGTNSSNFNTMDPLLRCTDSTAQNCYLIGLNPFIGASIYKRTGGSLAAISGQSNTGFAYTNGTAITIKAQASGNASSTTISYKVWQAGTSEPSGWTGTATDTNSAWATGNVGITTSLNGSATGVPTIDNFYLGDAGITFPGASTFAVTGPWSGTVGSTSAYTVTPNAAWTGTFTPTITGSATGTASGTLAFSASATPQTFTVTWSGAGTASVSGTPNDSLQLSGSAVSTTVGAAQNNANLITYLTAVSGWPSGLSPGFAVYTYAGTLIQARSTAVSQDVSGSYSATFATAASGPFKVAWDTGTGTPTAYDYSPQPANVVRVFALSA